MSSKGTQASASKSFGIDLNKFPSTSVQGIEGYLQSKYPQYYKLLKQSEPVEYERKIINGKAYRVPVKAQ
jgi:hypothetical protein